MPRWAKRPWRWERLTTGKTFFQALQTAVHEKKITEAEAWLNTWQAVAGRGDERTQHQWQVMQALLTCAQIAAGNKVIQSTDVSPPLPPAAAEDACATFAGQPRRVVRAESLSILLLINDNGVIAQLTLEQLQGRGERKSALYPDPEVMAFVTRAQSFREAEQNALAHLRAEGLWQDSGPDVRWRL